MEQENLNEIMEIEDSHIPAEEKLEKKYLALRFIAGVFKVMGWIMGIAGFIYFLCKLEPVFEGDSFTPLIIFIIGLIFMLWMLAASEIIKVFIDIEYNTRKSSKK